MLPPTTKLPNASTTWPASPSSRIRRVTETLIARRKSVVRSRIVGNDEKSSARGTYIVATTIISAAEMFSVMKKSSSSGGSGMISIATIRTMPPAASEVGVRPILDIIEFMQRPSGGRRRGRRRREAAPRRGTCPRGSDARSSTLAYSVRASGGSGTIMTPASLAASRILNARLSTPLATTMGACRPLSYLSATE